ncbi:hypothetical protein SEA_LIDONG_15 [Gordonia phage Lidong]|nr:hypothetical protein SEA_LIDONG_15 [Gordonia phage Lidong]WAA19550.1 hypothetical protein SEA_GALACTICEYE_15 [Gordonia phage GalacticEye]
MAENEVTIEAEAKEGLAVGRPDNPEAAVEADKPVYSDEERDEYARFGATPLPEAGSFGATLESDKDEEVKEEKKPEPKKSSTPSTPTPPSSPKA